MCMPLKPATTRDCGEVVQFILETIGIFDSRIPMSVRAAETSAEGKSIYIHDPRGKVAKSYEELTEEVLVHE